jgi:hypothetical protein
MAASALLIQKINVLPQEHLGAVERFVDSIQHTGEERDRGHAFAVASSASFAAVWDNDADAVYDDI